jgi:hypothetical protein
MTKTILLSILLFTFLFNFTGMSTTANIIPDTAFAAAEVETSTAPVTSLNNFVLSVSNGDSEAVVGVYVPGVLALPVGQQPKDNAGFVTRERNMTTQFHLANRYGTVGILAHNYLAGEQFSGIKLNQYAIVVFGDGRLEYFLIDEIQNYQALSPNSTYSDFINLDNTTERLTASELFGRVYGAGNRVVFQTCIAAHGDASWGRMFIIGKPATNQVSSVLKQTSFMLQFASFGLASR